MQLPFPSQATLSKIDNLAWAMNDKWIPLVSSIQDCLMQNQPYKWDQSLRSIPRMWNFWWSQRPHFIHEQCHPVNLQMTEPRNLIQKNFSPSSFISSCSTLRAIIKTSTNSAKSTAASTNTRSVTLVLLTVCKMSQLHNPSNWMPSWDHHRQQSQNSCWHSTRKRNARI